jgi:class 3 adenylate cyclase/pimeloyl-ACP methyl ester carboxylesterase
MFVDLVGSTALAQSLDPEDLRRLIGCYHDACTNVISGFEGLVAKYLGDGVLAYFGWPRVHEDEALRAVQAGIAIADAVARIAAPGGSLSARIGIATGLVIVGDLLGEGAAREEAVIGETPNLAARLQQIAAPGTVVIAESTRRLLSGAFELEDLGEQTVRGFARPVRAWRIAGERLTEDRFEARRAAGLTPLAGREREIALLLDRWALAEDGEGQVVLLVGEAGIGKSRITEALRERIGQRKSRFLRYQCSPQHMGSVLHPIIARFEHAAVIRRDDDALVKLEKLEGLLAQESASAPASLFAALLGIPTNGRYPSLALTPQQQKAKTLEALVGQIEAMAAQSPVLLVFEDLHWIDPTSLDLLGILVDRLERWPVLAVLTYRPEFQPPWADRSHATLLSLNRLGRRDATTLATRVGGDKAFPAEVMDQILARTDGVPLFLEELTKLVLESGLLEEKANTYLLRGPLAPLAIPTTLNDSLMARLDRLASVKEVAQLAACIGREFSHDILAAVSPLADNALTAALDQLAASELIHRIGTSMGTSYTFRHALVQEAAYESLLKSKRQELHRHIARGVSAKFPEMADLQPEWLAHHYMEAGMVEPAADYWLRAAHRAKAAYALSEAAAHLDRCLDALSSRSDDKRLAGFPYLERQRQVHVMIGDVASLTGEVDAANKHYERALGLTADADTQIWIENKRHRPHTVVRASAKIAFYEHGSGPVTLMFVAPLAYGLAAIQPVLERLCQEFRIVTVDPRGSGASDPLTRPYPLDEHLKDVRAILAALGDQPIVGVGISRFGNLLLKLAHSEPWLFEKLVTIGTPPGDNSKRFFPDWYIDTVEKGRETEDIEHLIRSHTKLLYSEPEMRELQEQTVRNRLLLPRETILSFFDPDPDIDLIMLTLGAIRVPTLVTHGRDDRLVAFAAAEEFAARLPNARLCPFEGKGHLPIFTATDKFCEVLRKFVLTDNTDLERRP